MLAPMQHAQIASSSGKAGPAGASRPSLRDSAAVLLLARAGETGAHSRVTAPEDDGALVARHGVGKGAVGPDHDHGRLGMNARACRSK